MSKRALVREETRRRIVEATAKLHGERGVFGTSWQDIAKEADVSVATVYAYFPSLDELLPACGALVMERIHPPARESSNEIIGDAQGLQERFERIALELFGFYERGGPHIEVDVRERQLPGMREWETYLLEVVTARVRAAMAPQRPSAHTVRLVSAFFDLPSFKALRNRGIATSTAARTVASVAASLLDDATQRKNSNGERRRVASPDTTTPKGER
jgi:AcrR family transcriptional regulator